MEQKRTKVNIEKNEKNFDKKGKSPKFPSQINFISSRTPGFELPVYFKVMEEPITFLK